MPLITIRGVYHPSEVLAAESLLGLMAPSAEWKKQLCERLHQELSMEGDYDYFSESPIIWVLMQFSGFYVGWKDGESFKRSVEKLAHDWGIGSFRFPSDFNAETDDAWSVPELMQWARCRLEPHGLLLWHWNTDEDNYCGAISREKDWPEIVRVCESLGVAVLPGDRQFDGEIDP